MDKNELRKLQLTQLEILKEVHNLCQKNNIVYYLVAGTLLGSVRHNGFIPWDVDIDVAMMRDDYEKFASICKTQLNHKFLYLDYKNQKHYYSPHAKICIKNTKIVYKNRSYNLNLENKCVYIDIFPLDNVPINYGKQKKQKRQLNIIKKIKYYKKGLLFRKNLIYKICKFLLKCVFCIVPLTLLNKIEDKTMKKYNRQKSTKVTNMASAYDYFKELMDKNIYGKPALAEFEGQLFYVPNKSIEYLKQIYGDYMLLPPENKRYARAYSIEKIIYDTKD